MVVKKKRKQYKKPPAKYHFEPAVRDLTPNIVYGHGSLIDPIFDEEVYYYGVLSIEFFPLFNNITLLYNIFNFDSPLFGLRCISLVGDGTQMGVLATGNFQK